MSEAQERHTTGTSKQSIDLRGKVVVITGASSGIGEAIAEAFVRKGACVALAARRVDRLEALAARLAGEGQGETLTLACDVRQEADVQALIATTLERWGQIDILVANAGFGYRKPLVDGDTQRWKDMIDTNVFGLLLTLKHGAAPMVARKSGQVVIMSSIAGRVVTPGGNAYCGTKAAATAIGEALRMEVAAQGVRVTILEPGVVISEFQEVAGYTPDIVANMLKGAEPLYPADIASTVLFACEQPASVGLHNVIIRATGQSYP